MANTLKALGALLTYPTTELQAASPEIRAVVVAEPLFPETDAAGLHKLIDEIAARDILDLQERYVALFDRGRATSLNLFEHVHGESRERGPAMVDLMKVYENAGFSLASSELPDYLPLILEFLSQRPFTEAHEMLSDCAHIVRKLGEALRERSSLYHSIPVALLAMIKEPGLSAWKNKESGDEHPAEDKTLDEDWMDSPVIFGPEGAPDCGKAEPGPSVIHFMPRQSGNIESQSGAKNQERSS